MTTQAHWESVYQEKDHELVSWFQSDPERSLRLIQACSVSPADPVVDVGSGCSVLVDRLLDAGHTDVTVLDLSPTALAIARNRLGKRCDSVTWIDADVTHHRFDRQYAVWHDRAVFHFLTDADSRARYLKAMRDAVAVDGHAIIATFSLAGPDRCSGFEVERYDEDSMSRRLGGAFEPIEFEHETHITPSGAGQEYIYGRFRRIAPAH